MSASDEDQENLFASESAQPGPRGPDTSNDVLDDEEDDDRIDWYAGEDVAVQQQRAIAVYLNSRGGIVLRAERADFQDEDPTIVLAAPGAAYRLIEAIQKQLEILKEHRKR